MKPKHPWIARLTVGIIMLVLAFLGIVLTDLRTSGGWEYWKWTVPIYAVLALWLSWYIRRTKDTVSPIALWHEMLHWLGLFAAIVLVEVYIHVGLLNRSLASLFALTLLSLTVFTIGIYIETTFILIGIVLGIFAAVVAIAIKFLYAFTIPALILGIIAIGITIWHSHKKVTHQ